MHLCLVIRYLVNSLSLFRISLFLLLLAYRCLASSIDFAFDSVFLYSCSLITKSSRLSPISAIF